MSGLTSFEKRTAETVFSETFVGMFSNGWTDLAPGGDWWGGSGAWAVFGFGTDVPEARAQKTLTGFVPNTLNVIRVNMSWSNASAGDPSVYSFGAWVNDVYKTLPAPGWLGGAAGDLVFVALADESGEIDAKVGGINFFGSVNVIGGFNTIEGTTLVSEFADIIIDSATLIEAGSQVSITRGSLSFDPGEEWDDYQFPGRTMNTLGARELVRMKPVIKGNLMMTGEREMGLYRPDGTWAGHATIAGARTFTPGAMRTALATGVYMVGVYCVWKRLRKDYIAVEFPFAICGSYGIGSQDGDEGLIPVVIEAVQDPTGATTKTAIRYRIHTLPADTQLEDLT